MQNSKISRHLGGTSIFLPKYPWLSEVCTKYQQINQILSGNLRKKKQEHKQQHKQQYKQQHGCDTVRPPEQLDPWNS